MKRALLKCFTMTLFASSVIACSPADNRSLDGSATYRLLSENQFLIEASGHWLTTDDACDGIESTRGIRDIKLSRETVFMDGGEVRARWEQIDELDSVMRQVRQFSRNCEAVDESKINIAFLRLVTGPIAQVIAITDNRHMFIITATGDLSYWVPFADVDFSSLTIEDIEEPENEDADTDDVDYVLDGDEARFRIE
ncbi:hypothetical protein [Aliidiomarina quisquiliarum]|uniref:hypothetical protein n=1 Tax=Aliidiomarina quisquiliarum TaxID=2938947 RepID=UPI00208FD2C5|nr:hypothetical protein [Aliidiomarina quisquiliarum]MCO4319888.1 hypothetical protein [Aliidiomarina quisquiliarum]